jgi:type I restriction enzyme S subunit
MVPLKHVSYMKGRIGWQGLKQSEFIDEGPYLITGMNFQNGKMDWDICYHISEERYNEAPEIQLKEGDILMTKDGTIGKLLYIGCLPGRASLNSHLLLLRPLDKKYKPKYLYYLFHTDYFLGHIDSHKTGTTFYGITQEAMGIFKMPIFESEEQRVIISYLDRKTRQIDDLIDKKRRMIELLKEERAAVINYAITKGLNPKAKMKDSGIEWLGKVPTHWELLQIKWLFDSWDYGVSDNLSGDGEYIVLTMSYMQNGGIVLPEKGCLDDVPSELLLDDGDLLFNRTNSADLVAKVALFKGTRKDKVSFASYLVRFRANDKALPEYLNFLLNSTQFISYARSLALPSINQSNLNPTRYGQIKVGCPPVNEQTDILEYLKDKCRRIGTLITKEENLIATLQEYRTALISEVVTGKIDVRGGET